MKRLLLTALMLAVVLCAGGAFAATTGQITYIVDPEAGEDLEALTPRTVETLEAAFADAASPYSAGDDDLNPFTDIRIVIATDLTGDYAPTETILIDDDGDLSSLVNVVIEGENSNRSITSPSTMRHIILNKSGATLTLNNVTLAGNSDGGGGIWVQAGTLIATNTVFSGNDAGALVDYDEDTTGGALHLTSRNATATLTACTFTDNTSATGGAIHAQAGSLTVSGGTFSGNGQISDNTASGAEYGGAVYITADASVTIADNPTFSGNYASNSGGAVYSLSALTLNGAAFSGNTAGTNGGAISTNSALTITAGTFVQNRAESFGGAVHIDGASGSDISGASFGSGSTTDRNSAQYGGAVYISGGSATFSSTTFDANSADVSGGGLFAGTSGTITFGDGVTFSGNIALNGGGLYASSGSELYASTGTLAFTRNSATDGGALWVASGAQTNNLTSAVTFTGNSATNGGAIYVNERSSSFVLNSSKAYTFTENRADYGGAVYTLDADVLIEGVEISGASNTANYGGGFVRSGGSAVIREATLSGQRAKFGGAVYSVGDVSITNSSFTSNYAETNTSDYPGGGGAVYVEGKITVSSSDFTGNRSTSTFNQHGGGAIFVSGDAVIDGSVFSSNQHTNSATNNTNGGGAIHAEGGTLTITNSTFSTNRAAGASSSFGGAVYANNSGVNITNSLIQGNSAVGNGGAFVFLANSSSKLTNSTFTDNSSSRNGGAIYAQGNMSLTANYFYLNRSAEHGGSVYYNQHNNPEILGTVTLENSLFTQNSAGVAPSDGNGGALYLVPDVATINRCTFDNNLSSTSNGSSQGGALFLDVSETISSSPTSIRNSTFWNNQTGNGSTNYGGAIYSKGNYTITSCTIVNNSASPSASRGGGIYVDTGTLTITATILVGNYSAMGRDVYANGSITSRGYNRIGIYAKGSDTSWKADISDSTYDRENSSWTTETFFGSDAALTHESSAYTAPTVGSTLYETVYLVALLLNEVDGLAEADRATNIIPYGRRFVLNIEQYDEWGVDRFASGNDITIGALHFGGDGGGGGTTPEGSFDIASITMSGIPNTLKYPGQTASLIAMVRYTNGRVAYGVPSTATSLIPNQQERVIWSSSNSNAVTVDQNGNITALRATSGTNGVTITVQTVRYTLAGQPASTSRNVIVTDNNGYDYMNISPAYYTYFTQNVLPNLFEYDISAAIADLNPQTVKSSTFRSNFRKVWTSVTPSQITELTTSTPTFSASTSAPAVSGKSASKRAGVDMNYQNRSAGELLAVTYSWTFTGAQISAVMGYDMTSKNINAALAGEIFGKFAISYQGNNRVIPVIGGSGISGAEAYEAGMLSLTKADGNAGLRVELTAYVGNLAVTGTSDGTQVIRSAGTAKALVVPDGVADTSIAGSMWMFQPAGTSSGGSSSEGSSSTTVSTGGSGGGGGGGCDAAGLGIFGAIALFLKRRH